MQDTTASPTHSSYLQCNLALIRCSDVTRGLSQGDTQLKGPHWLTIRKYLRNDSKSGIERLYKNPKSPDIAPKNAKKQQSTETKRSKYQNASQVGARYLHLAWQRGGSHPCHPSVMPLIRCISNMNSYKFSGQIHTSQSVRFSKPRTQSACFEYIDTIVVMRFDQPSY